MAVCGLLQTSTSSSLKGLPMALLSVSKQTGPFTSHCHDWALYLHCGISSSLSNKFFPTNNTSLVTSLFSYLSLPFFVVLWIYSIAFSAHGSHRIINLPLHNYSFSVYFQWSTLLTLLLTVFCLIIAFLRPFTSLLVEEVND